MKTKIIPKKNIKLHDDLHNVLHSECNIHVRCSTCPMCVVNNCTKAIIDEYLSKNGYPMSSEVKKI